MTRKNPAHAMMTHHDTVTTPPLPAKAGSSVSHGTLNPAHLIPAFCDALEDLTAQARAAAPQWRDWPLYSSMAATCRATVTDPDADGYDPDDIDAALSMLMDTLHDFSPPGCCFKAHEGDGSDFGFWPWSADDDMPPDPPPSPRGEAAQDKTGGAMVWLTDDEASALKRLVAEFLRDGGRMDGDDDAAAAAFATALESAAAALHDPDAVVEMVVSDRTPMVFLPAPPDTTPAPWGAPLAGNDAAHQIARTLSTTTKKE